MSFNTNATAFVPKARRAEPEQPAAAPAPAVAAAAVASAPAPASPPAQPKPAASEPDSPEDWEREIDTPASSTSIPEPTAAAAAPSSAAEPAAVAAPEPSPAKPAAKVEAAPPKKKPEAPSAASAAPKKAPVIGDGRAHLNIVFIGHVDAGKSTLAGQILLQTGQVDDRTIAKYEREAKDKNRESWWIAYIMDTNDEERAKGKTVEVGRAHFTTASKRFTVLDAPGHKNYVPNMIGGASQADVGVLVISARKGEFEAGFNRGGQTREHALLAKTLGISRLVVVVNKMDTKNGGKRWNRARFAEIHGLLGPFLKKTGFKDSHVQWVPISAISGANVRDAIHAKPVVADTGDWSWCAAQGKDAGLCSPLPLIGTLDTLEPIKRDWDGALRVPIIDKFKDMGSVIAAGKIEAGTIRKGDRLVLAPTGLEVDCVGLEVDDEEVAEAPAGENVLVTLKGVSESELHPGQVLCRPERVVPCVSEFEAQLMVLDLLPHSPLMTSGYQAVLHVHALAVECEITALVREIVKKSKGAAAPAAGAKRPRRPRFLRSGTAAVVRIKLALPAAMETYKNVPQLARFTLRDEGTTIAIGKCVGLISTEERKA